MKKIFLTLAIALVALTACGPKEPDTPAVGETKELSLDATSFTTWHYISLKDNKVVGVGEETEEANAEWFARTDWDIAIQRYKVRTNSGAATTVGAKGGVYTFPEDAKFESINAIPDDVIFVEDKAVTEESMMGVITEVKSTAQVVQFKVDEDGQMIMPPVYLASPVYLFQTADGAEQYKLFFTQYLDETHTPSSGYVKFKTAKINKK